MSSAEETCPLCGKTRDEHAALEAARILNHKFATDGGLVQTEHMPAAAPKREVMVVPGADLLVRQLLIAKGVLSEQDFINAGALGYGSEGDTRPRPI